MSGSVRCFGSSLFKRRRASFFRESPSPKVTRNKKVRWTKRDGQRRTNSYLRTTEMERKEEKKRERDGEDSREEMRGGEEDG